MSQVWFDNTTKESYVKGKSCMTFLKLAFMDLNVISTKLCVTEIRRI